MNYYNFLSNYLGKECLVSLFTNKEQTDSFALGFVVAIDDDNVLLAHVNTSGDYDGFKIKNLNSIIMIETDTLYQSSMYSLYQLSDRKHDKIELVNNDAMKSLLLYAKQKQLVVAIQLLESDYCNVQGFVYDFSETDNIVTINNVDRYGVKDGFSYINIDDVSKVMCDSEDEQTLRKLSFISNNQLAGDLF